MNGPGTITGRGRALDTRQAAARLGLAYGTLCNMRTSGGGPVFHKHGRAVRYYEADLDAWSAAGRLDRTPADERVAS